MEAHRTRTILFGATIINGLVLLTLIFIGMEVTDSLRSKISDYGALLGLVVLFFIIPTGAACLWFMNHCVHPPYTRRQRLYLRCSHAIWTPAWLLSSLPVAIYISILQPWPISLREGPDTSYAIRGFQQITGMNVPNSITEIYYRAESGWQDSVYRLKFHVSDSSVVEKLVGLKKLDKSKVPLRGLGAPQMPRWWNEKGRAGELETYFRIEHGSYFWYLWYDPENMIVYYEESRV